MNFGPSGCSRITSSSGSRPCDRPCARRLFSVSTAWPDSSSFCISSNRRAGGTFWMRPASFGIGAAVLASIATPTLAARRTARSMRTGSSRKRVTGGPISFSRRARTSATPPT